MSDSREHKCPRCGASLLTVTVKKPTYHYETRGTAALSPQLVNVTYEEHEEPGECFRCTGSY